MKIALIGYGVMGQLIERLALNDGHEIGSKIDIAEAKLSIDEVATLLKGDDVAIDFSIASAVQRNVTACMKAGIPIVIGTTGWNNQLQEVRNLVDQHKGALLYGANFSIGVNIFYRIVANASKLFRSLEQYDPFMEEAHHKRKKDAPSGTALKLRDIVTENLQRDIPITSTRAGYIPGTHLIGFDSLADQITLTHTARSREGFASGALLAAKWIIGKRGTYEFTEAIDEIVNE
jgi:4-hydroxy-tetrahydrodipicolinate reductase